MIELKPERDFIVKPFASEGVNIYHNIQNKVVLQLIKENMPNNVILFTNYFTNGLLKITINPIYSTDEVASAIEKILTNYFNPIPEAFKYV